MMVTCMQKRLKNKSLQNAMEVTCKQKLEYKVQVITEHMVITCMQKKVKIKFQLNPERQGDQMPSEEGKHQVQLNAGSHGGHLQGVELGVHHIRCVHRSHLQSGFLN